MPGGGEGMSQLILQQIPRNKSIEIIDIECVLLSFLSQKFVPTKWRIQKGIFARFRLLKQGISRGCGLAESEIVFFKHSIFKKFKNEIKLKNSFSKEDIFVKNSP